MSIRLGVVSGLLLFLAACPGREKAPPPPQTSVVAFNQKRLKELTGIVGLRDRYVERISRNGGGSAIYLEISGATNHDTIVETVTKDGVKARRIHGVCPAIADDGHVVASVLDDVLVFETGYRVPLSPASRFGFSPGAAFFFLHELPGASTVSRSVEPQKPLLKLPAGFYPRRLFIRGGDLFVYGGKVRPNGQEVDLCGYVLCPGTNAQPWRIAKSIDLAGYGGVLDMDIENSRVLVDSKRDFMPTWAVVDLDSRKRQFLGLEREFGLFLADPLRSYIEKRR